jgi:tRNA nucleotidyltransferase/poly(A) polymerase
LDQHRIPSRTLSLYAKAGALGVLYPELDELRTADHSVALNRWEFTLASIDELPPGNAFLRLAQFLHLLDPKKVVGILVRLRFSNAQTDETSQQASASPLPGLDADDEAIRRWLSSNSPERLNALARLELARARARPSLLKTPSEVVDSWRRARLIRATGMPLSISDLAIDGNDLIRIGLRPGPNFARILEDLLDFVLTDPTQNERGVLKAHVEARLGGYEE